MCEVVWRSKALLVLGVLLLLHAGCGDTGSEGAGPRVLGPGAGTQPPLPRAGAAGLRVDDIYANRARALYFDSLAAQAARPRAQLDYRFRAAVEWLRAGATEHALQALRALYRDIDGAPFLSSAEQFALVKQIYPYLGTAYLRLGEQANCQGAHGGAYCLFPIEEAGVYEDTRGPEAAQTIYASLLKQNPGDLAARWLLNLSFMNLGQYPDSVPPQWRFAPSAFASAYPLERFRNVAPAAGLAQPGLAGGGVVDDFTGDKLLDVMVSSWGPRDTLRLFVNEGNGRFVERTRQAGLHAQTGGLHLQQADYDNDGHLDVYVLRGGWRGTAGQRPNTLLRNDGDGTFTDVTEAAGLRAYHPTQTAAWADFDGDGWLDLFVGRETVDPAQPHPTALYLSDGDGTFTDVAAEAGIAIEAYVKGVTAGDYDGDGRPDLYLSVYSGPNRLFRNVTAPGHRGGPRFEDVTEAAGVAAPRLSFPTWFFDYDQDGWLDLFVADFELDPAVSITHHVAAEHLGRPAARATAHLYRNRGDGTFEDVTVEAGLNRITQAMGSNYGDLDGDGWLDLYLGTGDPNLDALVPNRMFRNAQGQHFQDVTTAGGGGHLQKGHAVSFADLDNDGDQDVHVVMGGAYEGDFFQNVLFENPYQGRHRWIKLTLVGQSANRSAIGSRVRIEAGGQTRYRWVGSGGSFGANPLRLEVGLGDADHVDAVEIQWAGSGLRQRLTHLPVNQHVQIEEGVTAPQRVPLHTFAFESGGTTHGGTTHGMPNEQ